MPLYFPGEMIADRYRVERELGSGGFGDVYEATDPGIERRVAIKVLKPDDGRGYKPSTKARFQREARAVGALRSPHTVTLLDFGESDDKLFMVFELVPGEDLRTMINREGRLDPKTAVHILRQLLDSLGEAHRAGILHRDIKPANIRVFPWGDNPMFVKLLDFGLARPSDDGSPGVTKTGEVIGTPRYMSPEQLSASPLTPASDIYSLGIVFLEMLVGSSPLQGNRWSDQFDRMMTGHVFSFPELERIGPDLIALMHRMTARDASQRLGSAHAVVTALDGAPTSRPEPERHPPQRSMIAAVLIGLAVLLAALWFSRVSDRFTTPPRVTEPGTAATRHERRPAVNPPSMDSGTITEAWADVSADTDEPAPVIHRRRAAPTPGCSNEHKGHHWGLKRVGDLTVFLPEHYRDDVPSPLLIVAPRDPETRNWVGSKLGGLATSRETYLRDSGLLDLADEHGFVLATPLKHPGLNDLPMTELKRAVDRVGGHHCLDSNRFFVLGDNSGGRLAHKATCEEWIDGVAVWAFIPGDNWRDLWCDEPKPTLWFVPRDSDHAPIDGPNRCSPYGQLRFEDWVAKLSERNGCQRERQRIESIEPGAECYAFECGALLWSCVVDGPFGWPGTDVAERDLNHDKRRCRREGNSSYPLGELVFRFFDPEDQRIDLAEPKSDESSD